LKNIIIFPPQWVPVQPYLSLPALSSYIKSKGINIRQKDLNVETYDFILTKKYIEEMVVRVQNNFDKLNHKRKISIDEQKQFNNLFKAKSIAPLVIDNIEDAKNIYRDDRFYDFKIFSESRKIVSFALDIVSAAYYPTKIDFFSFDMRYSDESSEEILKATIDRNENPYIEVFEKLILSEKGYYSNCDLIGISITSSSQIIPSFTLLRIFKLLKCKAHIVIGGNIFTRLFSILTTKYHLFSYYFDSIIQYEGERPLLDLITAIKNKHDLSVVPNLIYLENDKINVNKLTKPVEINLLPTPSFDDLPLHLYFSPKLVLPISSSRGCYWNKCTFCDHGYVYGDNFSTRNAEKVVKDIEFLSRKFSTNLFFFVDETISPNSFLNISKKLLEEKINVQCIANARFEKQFKNQDFCQCIAKAGFKVLLFGLESGCNRVLKLMNKGINKETIVATCTNTNDTGIWNHAFLLIGFPTETKEELKETIDFVISNKNIINSVGEAEFVLTKCSHIGSHPDHYNLNIIKNHEKKDFELCYNYSSKIGMKKEELKNIHRQFEDLLKKEYINFSLWSEFEHEHLLLYIFFYGIDKVLSGELDPIIKEAVMDYTDKPILELIPYMKKHLNFGEFSFNLVDIQNNIEQSKTNDVVSNRSYIVYDCISDIALSLTKSAYDIINLCNKKRSIDQIAYEISNQYEITYDDALNGCLRLLNKMNSKGILYYT